MNPFNVVSISFISIYIKIRCIQSELSELKDNERLIFWVLFEEMEKKNGEHWTELEKPTRCLCVVFKTETFRESAHIYLFKIGLMRSLTYLLIHSDTHTHTYWLRITNSKMPKLNKRTTDMVWLRFCEIHTMQALCRRKIHRIAYIDYYLPFYMGNAIQCSLFIHVHFIRNDSLTCLKSILFNL